MPRPIDDDLAKLQQLADDVREATREAHVTLKALNKAIKDHRQQIRDEISVVVAARVDEVAGDARAAMSDAVDEAIRALVADWRKALNLDA